MSFLDAPIARCEAARTMVLTDQTQGQCACEHGCPPGRVCPLDGCFAEVSGCYETAPPQVSAAPAIAPARGGVARRSVVGSGESAGVGGIGGIGDAAAAPAVLCCAEV